MDFLNQFVILLFPVLFALTIHEFSHGLIAYQLGDDTAYRAGRLTLNPIKHLDPIGTLMLFIVHIGWAKPVPINPYNFTDIKKDTAIVSFAGPAANFIAAAVFSLIFRLISPNIYSNNPNIFVMIIFYTIFINIALGFFNLIPLPPLDGSKILGAFLSDEAYYKFQQFEKKGIFIFLGIIIVSRMLNLNIIGNIILPPIRFFVTLFTGVRM
ncbi:MAG: site-2 protease family protein [Candidatus Cloacimonetes bacterium]|nr:site-2 protease family protein [Candidatus Cloacimonadota bacterium]MBS3767755.1 site-2 protease family protein [Candidatus Cloacimonadota bacterium]